VSRRLISTGSPLERQVGYSRAVVSGEFCFVAGTTGYDYALMIMPDAAADQVRNAIATIRATLAEAGLALEDVVRARYVVTDRNWLPEVYAELGRAFGDIRPAATMTLGQLVEPSMKIEIDVTAHRPGVAPAPGADSASAHHGDETLDRIGTEIA